MYGIYIRTNINSKPRHLIMCNDSFCFSNERIWYWFLFFRVYHEIMSICKVNFRWPTIIVLILVGNKYKLLQSSSLLRGERYDKNYRSYLLRNISSRWEWSRAKLKRNQAHPFCWGMHKMICGIKLSVFWCWWFICTRHDITLCWIDIVYPQFCE